MKKFEEALWEARAKVLRSYAEDNPNLAKEACGELTELHKKACYHVAKINDLIKLLEDMKTWVTNTPSNAHILGELKRLMNEED